MESLHITGLSWCIGSAVASYMRSAWLHYRGLSAQAQRRADHALVWFAAAIVIGSLK